MPPSPALDATSILEQVPIGVALVQDEHVVFANRALQMMLGHGDRGALLGLPIRQLVLASHPDGNAREERWIRADGSVAMLQVVRTEMPAGGGVLLAARDIAQRGDRDTHLVVSDRLTSAGTLAAGVAHQINNPLAYVLANLGYLAEEVPSLVSAARAQPGSLAIEERLAELLRTIGDAREGAERVASIVRDLKLLSRVDDDTVEEIDVVAVLESACNIVWSQLQSRASIVKTYGELPRVRGNSSRLAQALVNLLLNAAQAIPEGHADRHQIRITTTTDAEGRAVVEVADTGAGIPPYLLSRIFDPFFTTRAVGAGTGLGLTIAHGIVSTMGGRIHVDSKEGQGSTFRVVLPGLQAPPRPTRPSPEAPRKSPGHRRCLLVDDEETLVIALQRTLSRSCDVVATTSAAEALERMLAGEEFDVVLCDVVMPSISGIDVYERVKAVRPELAKRFVFMTGGAFTPRMRAFLDAVPNPRLDKPFSPQQLVRVVEKLDEDK